ncbi:tetratricopeptide repeat protein [Legionella cincinnatiensis]|uniref:Protoheme IX biogenesis protein n=1 Tax=Legionella cincinnatiensis TaxID=28085 RepID=A0A378IP59_9GAMM|nr:tetratricopeptide repeat protein [Legionella cincinnatiensis]KTC78449.1 putative protoheme IX biogenesis protein [Legionella cincinnatiensis]STX36435.1 putative protoheme IX biogenesis protein [Legionella cincinnatiensis]
MKFFISWLVFLRNAIILLLLVGPFVFILHVGYLHASSTNESNANTLLTDYYSLRLKDPSSARMILLQAAQKFPDNELIQSELGYLLLQEENYQKALVYLKAAHRINPENSDYTMQIGYTLNSLHQYEEALKYFREVAATNKGINGIKAQDILDRYAKKKSGMSPENQLATISTAAKTVVRNMGINSNIPVTTDQTQAHTYHVLLKFNPKQAKIFLDHILSLYPNNVLMIREKGIQKLRENDYKDAIVFFSKAWSIKHDDELLSLLGEAWLRSGNLPQAEYWLLQGAKSSDDKIKNQAKNLLDMLEKGIVSTQLPDRLTPEDIYYILRERRTKEAVKILSEIIKRQPENATLQMEMGYFFLKEHQPEKALPYILKAHEIDSHNWDITLQGAYVYSLLKENKKAQEFFSLALKSSNPAVINKARTGLRMLTIRNENKKTPLSLYDHLMNNYYALQKEHPQQAQKILEQVLKHYPNDYRALREMGFLMIREKNNAQAVSYLIKAWELQPESYDLALQIGYLFDDLGKKRDAFLWFKKAFPSHDSDIRDKSYKAMINLGSQRFQFFNPPWFADIWSAPFEYSRFSLFVIPEHLRVGRSFGKRNQIEVYYNNYTNKDSRSRSGGNGQLPSIYDDNYILNGAGIRYYTNTKIPLIFYFEAGMAYDLIYRNRDRWRDDRRGGVLSWYYWGPLPSYAERIVFPFSQADDFYGDSSWFSRYRNDWITYGRIRKGYRVMQYRNMSLIAYARGFLIVDTNKYFYNNLVEYGPGIAIVPNNTWPVAFRLERRFGQYIKVNGPEINPYGSSYASNVAMFEMYYRF